jgi:VCBS repeat-containing protein
MALVLKDRVLETASAPGTGAVTLLGAVLGYQSFSSGVGNANTCYYTIADQNGANWEVGIGTYATAGNTLTRTTLISSSTGSTVNFSSGTQNVFVTYPAEKAVYLDAAGQATLSGQLNLTNASDFNLYASGVGSNFMQGRLAIGSLAFSDILSIYSPTQASPTVYGDSATNITAIRSSSDAAGPNMVLRKARGTSAAQTAVTSGDILGTYYFSGYSGTGNANVAYIRGTIGTFTSSTDISSYLSFFTSPGGTATPSENMRIAGGVISLGNAPGAESLRVTPVASAVNYYNITGGATGSSPYLQAAGSDANIHSQYLSKGTYGHIFNTGSAGNFQFYVAHTASAVNYLQATGNTTGSAPYLSAQGSDTNINLQLSPKGTGYVQTAAAYSPNLTLTDAATIAWDTSTGQVATFTFVSTNRTMGAPTNLKNGAFYALAVIQNGGSNTLTWNSVFKWAGGSAPTLSTAAGAKDYFTFRSDGTNLYEQGRALGDA